MSDHFAQTAVSLPATLRSLRPGVDDETRIRRTVHLAAAKIEALETTLGRLQAELRNRPMHPGVSGPASAA